MIPEANQPAVARGLREAFGVFEYEDIQTLTGGLSTAFAFKVVVRKTHISQTSENFIKS